MISCSIINIYYLCINDINLLKSMITKRHILFPILLLMLLISCSTKDKEVNSGNQIKDDLGNVFTINKTPTRIITLAPNLTEIIYFLDLEKYLVGNTLYCNYPPAAQKIEKVGDMLTFNYEKILTLKPDLIFITVEGNTKETYDKFKELGLRIFVSNPRNFEGIIKTIIDFGRIFHIQKSAERKIAEWDSTITKIRNVTSKEPKRTAMYCVELQPVMLAGKNTFINEFLEFCGLKNIAEDSRVNYPVFSREEILERNPDYILIPTGGDENISDIEKLYPEWKNLEAIKNKHVLFVDRDLYSRPGSRFVEAVEDLYSKTHPR